MGQVRQRLTGEGVYKLVQVAGLGTRIVFIRIYKVWAIRVEPYGIGYSTRMQMRQLM